MLAATALMAPGGASAASPTVYSGTFDGPVDYVNCTTPEPDHYATGDWSVTMHGTSAKGRTKYDAPEIDGAVHVQSRRPLRTGDVVTVKIDRADAYDLYGAAV